MGRHSHKYGKATWLCPEGDDIGAAFTEQVVRRSGAISETNAVASQEKKGVGMTAGHFSGIKRANCTFSERTEALRSFVFKAWPQLEIVPKQSTRAMFALPDNASGMGEWGELPAHLI